MTKAISASGTHCKVIYDIDQLHSDQLTDWGAQPDCLEGQSHSRGILLYKGVDNKPESGFWQCSPGSWKLHIPRDEFCHFVSGAARYTSDSGEILDITAGTCVHFKAGWTGICEVHQTLRNVYMLTA